MYAGQTPDGRTWSIDRLRRIAAVVADGHYLDRGALDTLLQQVERHTALPLGSAVQP
jgi:hypothetical protein